MRQLAARDLSNAVIDVAVRMSRSPANYWFGFVFDTTLGVTVLIEGLSRHTPSYTEPLLIFLGLFAFGYIEYFVHRWVFHGPVRLMAQGHAAHHDNPLGYDSLPFFLPALVLLGLNLICVPLIPISDALLLSSGILFGYTAYGLSHFVIHHVRFRHPLARKWAGYHHIHHYHPDRNFGVTSPLWDVLLGTRYVSARRPARWQPPSPTPPGQGGVDL